MPDQHTNGNGLVREVSVHDTKLDFLADAVSRLLARVEESSRPQWQTWFPAISMFLVLSGVALMPYVTMLYGERARSDELAERQARSEERALGNDRMSQSRHEEQQAVIDGNMQQVIQMFKDWDIRIQREMDLKDEIVRLKGSP